MSSSLTPPFFFLVASGFIPDVFLVPHKCGTLHSDPRGSFSEWLARVLFILHIEPETSHKLRACSQKGFCQFAYISCCNIATCPLATRQVSFHPHHNHRQTAHQLH